MTPQTRAVLRFLAGAPGADTLFKLHREGPDDVIRIIESMVGDPMMSHWWHVHQTARATDMSETLQVSYHDSDNALVRFRLVWHDEKQWKFVAQTGKQWTRVLLNGTLDNLETLAYPWLWNTLGEQFQWVGNYFGGGINGQDGIPELPFGFLLFCWDRLTQANQQDWLELKQEAAYWYTEKLGVMLKHKGTTEQQRMAIQGYQAHVAKHDVQPVS